MNLVDTLSAGCFYVLAGYSKETWKQTDAYNYLNDVPVPENCLTAGGAGYTCIFNWACMNYLYVSDSIKNILGYEKEILLNEGFGFSMGIIHPDDIQQLKELHVAIFNYYYNTPVNQRSGLRFSYNFRVQRADNIYIHLLRQSIFIGSTKEGKPTLEFVTATDITGFRNDNDMLLTVHQLSDKGIYSLCHEAKLSGRTHGLSGRERQVLELVRQGYTTKEIACKLYLSIETVKSHRKNIIAKMGAVNMIGATSMFFT